MLQVERVEARVERGAPLGAIGPRRDDLAQLRERLRHEEELYTAGKGATQGAGGGVGARLVRDTVGEDDIAGVVSAWTGVPLSKLLQGEAQKLVGLGAELDRYVVRD